MHDLVTQLHESWLNGNRSWVVEEILKLKKAKACAVSVYLFDRFDEHDRSVFGRYLEFKI